MSANFPMTHQRNKFRCTLREKLERWIQLGGSSSARSGMKKSRTKDAKEQLCTSKIRKVSNEG